MVVAIANLFHVVFGSLLATIPNFIQIGQKAQKLEIVTIGRFWLVWAGRSKNGRRYFKLILCCFCSIIRPHTKFHPNRTTNTEVRNFHVWPILVGWAGRSKKLILSCFYPNISPHTKFHPNLTKNTEVRNFHLWSILVGRAGRSKNGRSHVKHSESLERLTKDLCTKFEPTRTKFGQVSPL